MDYRATEAQFLEMVEDINLLRVKKYQAFIDLYLQLSASYTEKEWKAAASALKKLV